MHNKFAIIDELVVITGSYNWTHKAQRNKENIVIINKTEIVKEYLHEFGELLVLSRPYNRDDHNEYSQYADIKKQTERIDSVLKKALVQTEAASQREDGLSGVPSGFDSLDKITSGWQRADLIVIASRPSMGKTAFALSMARNIAVENNQAVAIFSLEMSAVQLTHRLIATETDLGSEKIRNGQLTENEWRQLEEITKRLSKAPIFVDVTPAITMTTLRSKCLKLKAEENISLVVVDYLQLMSSPSELQVNREQEVSQIARGLKTLARELNLPIIVLSQLNRSVEMRSGDKRPQLSDLRDSGSIEEHADIVIFIHRPEKMGISEDAEGNSTKGLAEIILAKHRNGETTDVELRFREQLARFEEPLSFLNTRSGFDIKNVNRGNDDFAPF